MDSLVDTETFDGKGGDGEGVRETVHVLSQFLRYVLPSAETRRCRK